MSSSTRGLADSTPSAQATAPPSAQRLGALGGQVLLGLEVGGPAQVEAGVGERACASLTQRLGRDRVLRQVEVARAVLGRRARAGARPRSRRRARGSWRCRPRRGRSGRTCTCPSSSRASDRRAASSARREVLVERQAVEVGRRQARAGPRCRRRAGSLAPSSGSRCTTLGMPRARARQRRACSSSARQQREQRVLALEDDRACRTARARARAPGPEADEQLRDGRPAEGQVHARAARA